jgi:hypothetical protein
VNISSPSELQALGNYVYVLLADDEPIVIGEGVKGRAKVLFPGFTIPSHIKAFTVAMATNLSNQTERIFITVDNKKEATRVETEIQNHFQFRSEKLDDKNLKLYRRRLEQLGIKEDKYSTIFLMPLILSTGSDVGTWRKILPYYEDIAPGFLDFVNNLFGGYYKPFSIK